MPTDIIKLKMLREQVRDQEEKIREVFNRYFIDNGTFDKELFNQFDSWKDEESFDVPEYPGWEWVTYINDDSYYITYVVRGTLLDNPATIVDVEIYAE
jgi:hypothetical protein